MKEMEKYLKLNQWQPKLQCYELKSLGLFRNMLYIPTTGKKKLIKFHHLGLVWILVN